MKEMDPGGSGAGRSVIRGQQTPGGRTRILRRPRTWIRDAVFLEIFPRAFAPEGTLEAISRRLKAVGELGINALCLMPVHPIGRKGRRGSCGSPYAVRNHFEVHPELGTKEDLRALVGAAHRLRMRVILDFVLGQAAADHVELAHHPEWLLTDGRGEPLRPAPGCSDVVCWNLGHPALREYLISAMISWLREADVDGFRLFLEGNVPGDFLAEIRHRLDQEKPGVSLLGWGVEDSHGFADLDALQDRRLHRILCEIRAGRIPASALVEALAAEEKPRGKRPLPIRYLESHEEKRAADTFGLDALEAYATLLFTSGGVPMLYNGQIEGDTERPSLFEKHTIAQEPLHPLFPKLYRKLIRARRENRVFGVGKFVPLPNSLPRYVASFARLSPRQAAVVVVNLREKKSEIRVEIPGPLRAGREDWMFADLEWQKLRIFRKPELFLELGPYEALIFSGEAGEQKRGT
ncbi:MAG: alpha-amylase family glycosyl hydrolase [candidate division KSB1 bacterium]|nr:alpha-amylase family glycosyl hydrolase [candidate division KSB1 bacterium]